MADEENWYLITNYTGVCGHCDWTTQDLSQMDDTRWSEVENRVEAHYLAVHT